MNGVVPCLCPVPHCPLPLPLARLPRTRNVPLCGPLAVTAAHVRTGWDAPNVPSIALHRPPVLPPALPSARPSTRPSVHVATFRTPNTHSPYTQHRLSLFLSFFLSLFLSPSLSLFSFSVSLFSLSPPHPLPLAQQHSSQLGRLVSRSMRLDVHGAFAHPPCRPSKQTNNPSARPGTFDDGLNTTGWGVLNVKTSADHSDAAQVRPSHSSTPYDSGYPVVGQI